MGGRSTTPLAIVLLTIGGVLTAVLGDGYTPFTLFFSFQDLQLRTVGADLRLEVPAHRADVQVFNLVHDPDALASST